MPARLRLEQPEYRDVALRAGMRLVTSGSSATHRHQCADRHRAARQFEIGNIDRALHRRHSLTLGVDPFY